MFALLFWLQGVSLSLEIMAVEVVAGSFLWAAQQKLQEQQMPVWGIAAEIKTS